MDIRFLGLRLQTRRHNLIVTRAGLWSLAIGIDHTYTGPWFGYEELRWVDAHGVSQFMRTHHITRRLAWTWSRTLGKRASIDEVSRWTRARTKQSRSRR